MRLLQVLLISVFLTGCVAVTPQPANGIEVQRYPEVVIEFPNGSKVKPSGQHYDAAVAPDCSRAAVITRAYQNDGRSWDEEKSGLQIFVLGEEWPISQSPLEPGLWSSPRFSPDSSMLAVIKGGEEKPAQIVFFDFVSDVDFALNIDGEWQRIDSIAWDEEGTLMVQLYNNGYLYYSLGLDGRLMQITVGTPKQFEYQPYEERLQCAPEN